MGGAPDVDDLPDVLGAELQEYQDVVGEGNGLLGPTTGQDKGCGILGQVVMTNYFQE